MASVATLRRYLLLKGRAAERRDDTGVALAFWGKQEAAVGSSLPGNVPYQSKLAAARYEKVEDLGYWSRWGDGASWDSAGPWSALDGADTDELVEEGLSRTEAPAVLKALGV